ncbi:MAG: di-trans,poly-cis-decaprenylcistransferase [Candidatus Peribacter sp.]|jgi:undecaprenyl diphosphate synthase|nr:di-trans,poly-cis-decaprenylcistransferase [Candidatus Peribacter sp.]MBT4392670.1 di-trans,poly-cis-decaprenylcistransferase [Candidatus Peribacter sp.]MBT4600713.1 di-trans,poly-cis-decaprenylcistransferase [Candidatus Peribacter sp.]MBT5148618.1 di-trans,poly-cis-decaprenylcistransferase [Candidatus Peribacter sp.]MBT5637786.1 di-trans,poly-cis-decaprenylcistransferase [Candidatus Peribacter sp.]
MPDNGLHIAIIPDGNRRWAKTRTLKPWEGHKVAIENFRTLTDWCREDSRVNTLTVWCFSTENWKRDQKEIDMLMGLLEEYLEKERSTFLENKTRFVHSGRKDRIPASLSALIAEVEEETKDQTEFTLHLAIDYGGKDEIVRALGKTDDKSEDGISAALDHPELSDIDLIIRTSGEHRTSNFFLWQAAYAEWDFIDKFFPDFSVEDLETSVTTFADRTRRFGG